VENVIEPSIDMEIFGYIVFNKFESFVTHQVGNIFNIFFLDQVIYTDNLMTETDEKIAEMGTEKACPTCDQGPFHNILLNILQLVEVQELT
jgi:hypothetical protein